MRAGQGSSDGLNTSQVKSFFDRPLDWVNMLNLMPAFWISFLRRVALLEGVSFLLLLGVAMPLKYWADMPLAVKIVGWIHGALFIALCLALLQVLQKTQWSISRCAQVFIAALLPFGPFVLDRKMRRWSSEESE